MARDRSWMRRRFDDHGCILDSFVEDVEGFLCFAYSKRVNIDNDGHIKCPCHECQHRYFHDRETVKLHLCQSGFCPGYTIWTVHGEEEDDFRATDPNANSHSSCDVNPYKQMLINAFGQQFDPDGSTSFQNMDTSELPNKEASQFFDLLKDADEPLWEGCKTHTVLSSMSELLHHKATGHMSDKVFDLFLKSFKEMLPEDEKLPNNFYQTKKKMRQLGLTYEKIHVCINNCMLYYKEDDQMMQCLTCGHDRYKQAPSMGRKGIPFKVLRYLPISSRLKRLYMSEKTAPHMTWHASRHSDFGTMAHPSDSIAWQHFNKTHPSFASEPRNVRLGLCTDGFTPFDQYGAHYSCWPVIITIYNLPPWMCMKEPYMFLNMVIPGPSHPGKDIDIFLRPLIDELMVLWDTGVETFDVSTKQNFFMKVALMWTISDLPAYAMLSGWCTQGKLACPHCLESSKAIGLSSGGKASFFDCHRHFLPPEHEYRRQPDKFRKGVIITDDPPPTLTGDQLYARVCTLPTVKFGKPHKKDRIRGFGREHNWIKRSIFWELPYWCTNLIRHNLDVMHIEKNVFENIFNTVMDVRGKTKDNIKAREDLQRICRRPHLELIHVDGKTIKPKASFSLSKDQQRDVYQWMKEIKLPDGYASNISRCVNVSDLRCHGMKSHDCHVILQTLLPVALRDMVPVPIWDALTEVSNFFKDLCARVVTVEHLEVLKKNIVVTLCKLENFFPPSFFDPCEHLMVHLPIEAILGGPVQYRWMYQFERFLQKLKKMVGNKGRVEASICEVYLIEETTTFCSLYFHPTMPSKINRVPRNDDGGDAPNDGRLTIFCHPGRPFRHRSGNRDMDDLHWKRAHTYILLNTLEVTPYVSAFDERIRLAQPDIQEHDLSKMRDDNFAAWLKEYVANHPEVDARILSIAQGPARRMKQYGGYFVNGFNFHTEGHARGKATVNSGVCVKGMNDDDNYYGTLEDIWALKYLGTDNVVVLFKCRWYDTTRRSTHRVHKQHGLVEIDPKSRYPTDEAFVLASQSQQVYYMNYPSKKKERKGWWVVSKTRARSIYEVPVVESLPENDLDTEIYQEDHGAMHCNVDLGMALDDDFTLVKNNEPPEVFDYVPQPSATLPNENDEPDPLEGLWMDDNEEIWFDETFEFEVSSSDEGNEGGGRDGIDSSSDDDVTMDN